MNNTKHLAYGEKEIGHLKSRDKKLGEIIDAIGTINRPVMPDIFEALVYIIIGQQISRKAHVTVWNRMQSMISPLTAGKLIALPVETLQSFGMTMKKAVYINEIAANVMSGHLDLDRMYEMDDHELCIQLSKIRGIGIWTAEMLMIFSMQRMNVLSWGDLAIQRGLRMLYRHRKITPDLFERYKKRYSPYATIASLYLWALAGGACEGYAGAAQKIGTGKK